MDRREHALAAKIITIPRPPKCFDWPVQPMPILSIDQYSVATVPIEMFFQNTSLSTATAFIWQQEQKHFLVTNWHNVSGKDPFTGKHLSKTAAEPDCVKIWFNGKALGQKFFKFEPLRDTSDRPLWWVHPQHGSKIDVVALPVDAPDDAEMHPINRMPSDQLAILIGMDVFVLGYPFGIGMAGLPVWKRASIASEPQLVSTGPPFFLVDTASRPGMSGSPVVRRSWTTHTFESGDVHVGAPTATKFVGVYSGRLSTNDPLDAQLGVVWPAVLVEEIVSGAKRE
jgi:hypothetical protein